MQGGEGSNAFLAQKFATGKPDIVFNTLVKLSLQPFASVTINVTLYVPSGNNSLGFEVVLVPKIPNFHKYVKLAMPVLSLLTAVNKTESPSQVGFLVKVKSGLTMLGLTRALVVLEHPCASETVNEIGMPFLWFPAEGISVLLITESLPEMIVPPMFQVLETILVEEVERS